VGDEVVGAISAGRAAGGDLDNACARAGLDLQQDWQWSELFSAQPEILSYANHVAERFDLRRLITFNVRVHAAIFDEASARWTVHTSIGETVTARYIVMATGCLSTGRVPDFPGIETFESRTLPHRRMAA